MAMMVASIVMTALDRVAGYANHLDEERSRETLVGAIQTFEHQLGATLIERRRERRRQRARLRGFISRSRQRSWDDGR